MAALVIHAATKPSGPTMPPSAARLVPRSLTDGSTSRVHMGVMMVAYPAVVDGSNTDVAVVVVIVAVRFVVPLFIPRFPLPAILTCLVVDAADQTILQQLTDLSLDSYQN